MTFEGHEKHTAQQPSDKAFPGYTEPTAAPGNGSLPPGANIFRRTLRKGASTTLAFMKKSGA